MIVTQQFVYLHTMKTGGHWVRALVGRAAPPSWAPLRNIVGKGQHRGYTDLTPELREMPIIAAVRNPWDWWVSWFFYMKQKPPIGSHVWVSRFADCAGTPEGFLKALPRLMNSPRGGPDAGVPAEQVPDSPQWRVLVDENGEIPPNMTVIRYESLREELLAAVEATGAEVSAPFRSVLQSMRPMNKSRHAHYSTYYPEPEHVEMLRMRERRVIDRFGYTFERPSP
jgi:hypothetical protein